MEDFFWWMLSRPPFLDDRRGFPHELAEDPSSAALIAAEREGKRYGVQGPEEQDNTKLASRYEGQTSDM